MKYRRQPRLGMICAFLYVFLFVAGTLYRTSQTALPDTTKLSALQQNETLLEFARQHGGLFAVSAILSVLGVAVLAGIAFGIYHYMSAHGKERIGRITLIVGVAAVVLSCVSTVVATVALYTAANDYAAHHLVSTVTNFQNQGTLFSILDVVGAEGLAIWLGLVAVTIIRIQGNRSIPGWSTLGACVLTGIGFPVVLVMVAWSTGAGVALWRLATHGPGVDPVEDEAPEEETIPPETQPVSARPASVTSRAASQSHTHRPAGGHGSAAKRRRRR